MKSICLSITILCAVLLSMTFVSAGADYPNLALNFGDNTGIDLDRLESFCTEDTCSIYDNVNDPSSGNFKQIIFRIQYQGKEFNIVANQNKDTNYSNLRIYFLQSSSEIDKIRNNPELLKVFLNLGLSLLKENDILYGISEKDIKDIAEIASLDSVIYINSSSCGGNGWEKVQSPPDKECYFEKYENGCPIIKCTPQCGGEIAGELVVSFENTTTQETARNLIESLGLNISEVDVAGWQIGLGMFVVNVPEGSEEQWIKNLESKETIKYVNKNYIICPLSATGGGVTQANFNSLSYLNFQKSSTIIYLIIGIAAVVIILALVLIRRKR